MTMYDYKGLYMTVVQGDLGPRGQMSKDHFVQGTLVQEDFFPMRLWSKETIVQGESLGKKKPHIHFLQKKYTGNTCNIHLNDIQATIFRKDIQVPHLLVTDKNTCHTCTIHRNNIQATHTIFTGLISPR